MIKAVYMMDVRTLRIFIDVAERSSFTKAANALGYSQSTVSFQIKQLEEELGAKLFERINHTVTLTDRGREVLRYAHQIDQLSREMNQAAQTEQPVVGRIRVALADSLLPLLLGERFLALRKAYPAVSLKLITAETEEMFRLLNHNEADLVLTLDSHIYNREYVIVQEEKIHTHFVAAAQHPLARQKGLSVQALLGEPFLLTERGMSYRRLMDEKLAERSLEISPVLECGSVQQICRLAEEGTGLSFLPDYATEVGVRAGRLARLDVVDFEVEIWKQLLYHRAKWVSPAMRAVMEVCAAC